MKNLTLRQLRAFRAVALTQSFTDAALALHLTPAAMSGLIKELESQLGVTLFDRNTRKVQLSGVGEEFFPLTERVLQDLDDAVLSVTNLKEKRRGVVRIAAPEVMSCTLVPAAMAAFRLRYPEIEVRFLDVPIEDVVDKTGRGEVDVGIAPGRLQTADVARTPFMRAPLMLAVRRDDPLGKRRQANWEDVGERQVISFFRAIKDWLPKELEPLQISYVRRINTALAMVQAGFGITFCPIYATGLANGFGLKLMPLGNPAIEREYALLTRANYSLSPPAQAFCAFVLEYAPQWAKGQGDHETPSSRKP